MSTTTAQRDADREIRDQHAAIDALLDTLQTDMTGEVSHAESIAFERLLAASLEGDA